MSSSWYFVKDGQRQGPLDGVALDARIADGTVQADTLVWRVGLSAWVPASSLPELGLPPPVPPPPLPPAATPPPMPMRAAGTGQFADASAGGFGAGWAVPAGAGGGASTGQLAGVGAGARARLEYGEFWPRFAAKLIDGVILLAIGMVVQEATIWTVFDGITPNPIEDFAEWWRLLLYTWPVNTAIALAYTVFFMRLHEATPGKRILGLRVVRPDGGRISGTRAACRYLAEQVTSFTFLVGYVMAAFDDEKRALHDFMCDTRVVRGPRREDDPG